MRIDQIKTVQDAQEWAAPWGYIILERQQGLAITNNGGPKREVYHEYKDLEHLKRWLHTYVYPPGSDEWNTHRDALMRDR